jgi:hypothetical protein
MHPESKFVIYEWRMTDTEKKEIQLILRNQTSKENIKVFISHLEFICDGKKHLLDQPKKAQERLNRDRILTDCKAALGHIKQISAGRIALWHMDTLKGYGTGSGVKSVSVDYLVEELENAWAVVGPLDKFVTTLERHHQSEEKAQGRKKADSDYFIKNLRDIYIEHIGMPTIRENGPFFRLVQCVLEIFNLPFADPSRAIKNALKKT